MGKHLVFSFLTKDSNSDVVAIHPDATPVLLLDDAARKPLPDRKRLFSRQQGKWIWRRRRDRRSDSCLPLLNPRPAPWRKTAKTSISINGRDKDIVTGINV
jgi:hypothetical protein